jgi:hypothetical protein
MTSFQKQGIVFYKLQLTLSIRQKKSGGNVIRPHKISTKYLQINNILLQ